MKKAVVAAMASLLLVGCSNVPKNAPDAEPAQETSASESQPAEQAEVVEAEPDPVTVEINCYGDAYYSSVEQAWPDEQDMCEAEASGTEMNAVETRAIETAYGDAGDLDSLGTLYGMCAQAGPESWDYLRQAGSTEQLEEVRGALVLCPDHPQKGKLKKLIGGAEERNKLEGQGRVFGAGVYRVGKEIKPGTYYSTDVEGCYWERTDANGEAIDNNFVTAAKRVQVTISGSDYSFNSESCGQWQPVGT
ncbi:hypothetical protein OHB05_29260 [Streptomyces sp. NBC_00638]|uniref:hypothetical protein n=1 Tax=Streptomyces sp. NBC_00638 TaxID=2975794 RepID=UPI00224DA4A7|nr:hypothetical protein [Streptomyces sp. NBC_00638]MCX5006679.1 hypothetical protein [Streptomyces sp. NBC_00638]